MNPNIRVRAMPRMRMIRCVLVSPNRNIELNSFAREGASPVGEKFRVHGRIISLRVGLLGNAARRGGKLHLRLNISTSPIEYKYREGKLKRTPKGELNRP